MTFCGGWKGWSSDQALAEDLNYIMAARIGHIEMLQAIFGKPEDAQRPTPPKVAKQEDRFFGPNTDAPPLTTSSFDKAFQTGRIE